MDRRKKPRIEDVEERFLYWGGIILPIVGVIAFAIFKYRHRGVGTTDEDIYEVILLVATLLITYFLFRAKESNAIRKRTSEFYDGIQTELINLRNHNTYGEIIPQCNIYWRKTECIRKCMRGEVLSGSAYAISLTSFRPDNPLDLNNPDINEYHRVLHEYIKEKNVSVRRLITLPTLRKARWIDVMKEDLLEQRFELRLYQAARDLPRPLTIDIYGKEHVFITYWNREDHPTHVYFVSTKIREMFESYYNSLWMPQEVLMKGPSANGNPAYFNQDLVTKIITELESPSDS